jgi:phytanoyl-CoA hydroxylase
MWIAIDDATRANGTIRVVPKRFNENIPHKRDLESDHHIHCPIDENDAIHAELPAGGVLFFCYGTPHATGDNPTPLDRAGLAYHFLNVDYAPEGFFDSSQRRLNAHPHITGVLASDGVNEYGESMREAWERCLTAASS